MSIRPVPFKSLLAILTVLAMLLVLVPPVFAQSLDVTASADNNTAGATATYEVGFTVPQAVYAGDYFRVIFDSAFNLQAVNPAEVTVVDGEDNPLSFHVEKVATVLTLTFTGSELAEGTLCTVTAPKVVNPTKVVEAGYTVSVRFLNDPPESDTVYIEADAPAALVITEPTDPKLTAGMSYNITAELRDKFNNIATAGGDIIVTFTDDDPQANFDGAESATEVISDGDSDVTVSWTARTAGTITIKAEAEGLTAASKSYPVDPGEPACMVLEGPTDLEVGGRGVYTVTLYDSQNNIAVAPAGGLAVTLASDPAGSFFVPVDAENPLETPQVDIAEGEGSAQFAFEGSEEALTTVAVSAEGVTGDQLLVAVGVTVLTELEIEAPAVAEVGIAVPITINLKDQHGEPFSAPQDGVSVTLSTEGEGAFYAGPTEAEPMLEITVLAGESAVTVYYIPGVTATGAHTLNFVTDKILSNGEPVELGGVTAEHSLTVTPASDLYLYADPGYLQLEAGTRAAITLWVKDFHGNTIVAPEGGRVVYLESSSATGKFYATQTSSEPITKVVIPAGKESVTVYYTDTESWTKKADAAGCLSVGDVEDMEAFLDTLAFRSEGVFGKYVPAQVNPGKASAITLDVYTQDVKAVDDAQYAQIGSRIGATDIIGVAKMRVGVVDNYGNPSPQYALLRVSVKDDSPSAFLWWDFAELEGGEWAKVGDAWLIVTAPGTYKVTATAGGLAGAEYEVAFEEPILAIYAESPVVPDNRIPVFISLSNLWAAGQDLVVSLSTSSENAAFYADDQSAEPITEAVIPQYGNWVMVYFESDDPVGTAVELNATIADLELTAQATVTVGVGAEITSYQRGWNIVSTPWVLEEGKNTIDVILANPEYVEAAYIYVDGAWVQVTSEDPATMVLRPLEAMYVKLKGQTMAEFWARRGLGTPPVRLLAQGWNLVGNPADGSVYVDEALASISGKYAVVVSPALNQDQWVYTPYSTERPVIQAFRGCWVWMTEAGQLAGLAIPPIQ